MKRYLAIDPGGNTGWAIFDEQGKLQSMGSIKGHDEFLDWLEDIVHGQSFEIIIERYRVRTGGKHTFTNSFSDVPTLQLIGAIKRIARKNKFKIHEQDPSPSLVIGLKFLGMGNVYKDKHVPDEVSALAHGTYWLRKNGVQEST